MYFYEFSTLVLPSIWLHTVRCHCRLLVFEHSIFVCIETLPSIFTVHKSRWKMEGHPLVCYGDHQVSWKKQTILKQNKRRLQYTNTNRNFLLKVSNENDKDHIPEIIRSLLLARLKNIFFPNPIKVHTDSAVSSSYNKIMYSQR